MFSMREYREPSHRLPDLLPWAALIAPGVILQKDALLQKTIAFRGPDLASSSTSELVSAVARLNNSLKRHHEGRSPVEGLLHAMEQVVDRGAQARGARCATSAGARLVLLDEHFPDAGPAHTLECEE